MVAVAVGEIAAAAMDRPIKQEMVPVGETDALENTEACAPRRSARPVKKRSFAFEDSQPSLTVPRVVKSRRRTETDLEPDLNDNVGRDGKSRVAGASRSSKPAPVRRGSQNSNHVNTEESSPPSTQTKNASSQKKDGEPSTGSVDGLLSQLVSTYCGSKGHPADCQDCKERILAIRALLQGPDTSVPDGEDCRATTDDVEESNDVKPSVVGLFSCSKCPEQFDTFAALRQHQATHRSSKHQSARRKPQQCKVCNKTLAASTTMSVHLRSHSGEKPFQCNDCGHWYASQKSLNEHRFCHTGLRPFACSQCGKTFSRKYTLNIHMYRHAKDLVRPYVCQECGRSFAQPSSLKKHSYQHMDPADVPPRKHYPRKPKPSATQECPDCGKLLSCNSSMQAHRALHSGERLFVCSVCGKSFTRRQHLLDHSTRHTGVRTHVCELCGARFSRAHSLKVHRRIHTGETPYHCEYCGATFCQPASLAQHVRSHHTLEKPYECAYCGQRFAWSKDRILHERRLHTGEQPFPCSGCERRFVNKEQMQKHWQSQHSDIPRPVKLQPRHSCPHCSADFGKKTTLARHIAKHFTSVADQEDCGGPGSDDGLKERQLQRRKPDASKVYSCLHCPAMFNDKALLRRHVESHDVENNDSEEEESDVVLEVWRPSVTAARSTVIVDPRSQDGTSTHGAVQVVDSAPVDNGTEVVRNVVLRVLKARESGGPVSARSGSHRCPHCQLSFSKLAMLSRHVRKHFGAFESEDEGVEDVVVEECVEEQCSGVEGH